MQVYEPVKVTYDGNNRIEVEGKTIKVVLLIEKTELATVYMGSEGSGTIIVSEK